MGLLQISGPDEVRSFFVCHETSKKNPAKNSTIDIPVLTKKIIFFLLAQIRILCRYSF